MSVCTNCGLANPPENKFCGACGTSLDPPAAPGRETRRTVTVLFCDVTGSTSLGERLDAESLRRVMSRYFEDMKAVLERHGGTVEKFIGDAIMAVFGIPNLHEDDALRAVRAGVEMRSALEVLNQEVERERGVHIAVRTGINTGEVVAGDRSEAQTLVTGDAVNVAARLEQSAQPGEILIGEKTAALVRDAAEVEAVEPMAVKGKGQPLRAFRLIAVKQGAPSFARHLDSPMVGRRDENALLGQAYQRAVKESSCHLFTLLGSAGVGKSRLVAEFLHGVGADATALTGRCLSYGEGITFFPVVDMIKQAAGISEDHSLAEASRRIESLLQKEPDAANIVERIGQLTGFTHASAASEEIFWAVRRLFELLAKECPLILLFDDLHWGEPTLLDLIEDLTDWSRGSPILVLCVARPELLDDRPAWAGGKLNATSLLLEPLSEGECVILIENLLDRAPLSPTVRASITRAAEGNPLFVEEMVAMLIDDGLLHHEGGHWTVADDLAQISVPPTIHALLAARLDRLKHEERQVIESASVIGQVFYRSAVFELSKETLRARVAGDLMALVRKELIRPDRSDFSGEDAFRFRHILVRDTAYNSLPKETRARLHETFADWLETAVGERIREYEEIIAYHLEQSFRYRSQLGSLDNHALELRKRAATRLIAVGRRALDRSDISAAVNLLERAESLLDGDDDDRAEVLIELGRALFWAGQLTRAMDVLDSAIEAARVRGDSTGEWRARVQRGHLLLTTDTSAAISEHVRTEIEQAIAVFESQEDITALAEAWLSMSMVHNMQGEMASMHEAAKRTLSYAQRAGNRRLENEAYAPLGGALINGPVPAREGIREMERELKSQADPRLLAGALGNLAYLRALNGEFQQARSLLEQARRGFEDFGMRLGLAIAVWIRGNIEALAQDWAAAEHYLRDAYERFSDMGDRSWLSTLAAELGQVVYEQGNMNEALRLTQVSEDLAAPDDIASQMMWRCLRAKVMARRGEIEQAEALALDSASLAGTTDMPLVRGQALMDLAEVLQTGGRVDEASRAAQEALLVYEAKGLVPRVAYARAALAAMSP